LLRNTNWGKGKFLSSNHWGNGTEHLANAI